jgi:hypothetical protein
MGDDPVILGKTGCEDETDDPKDDLIRFHDILN